MCVDVDVCIYVYSLIMYICSAYTSVSIELENQFNGHLQETPTRALQVPPILSARI
jgi:hypothetical protein